MIDLFHLHEFVDDLTERYSHGMRQRTVFAAALVHEPRLLIADEPTVGLDPKSVRELKTLLRRLAAGGMTVFLSTHTLDIAQELADRIGIIDRGRLIGCGTLDQPAEAGPPGRHPGGRVLEDHGGGRPRPRRAGRGGRKIRSRHFPLP